MTFIRIYESKFQKKSSTFIIKVEELIIINNSSVTGYHLHLEEGPLVLRPNLSTSLPLSDVDTVYHDNNNKSIHV